MIAQKRLVRVTLDISCYDDLDLEDINWREVLQLEGGEEVDCSIKDYSDMYWLWHIKKRHKETIQVPLLSYVGWVEILILMPTKFYIEDGHGCLYFVDNHELFFAPINVYGMVDLEESCPVDLADCETPEDEAQLLRIRDLLMPVSAVA